MRLNDLACAFMCGRWKCKRVRVFTCAMEYVCVCVCVYYGVCVCLCVFVLCVCVCVCVCVY